MVHITISLGGSVINPGEIDRQLLESFTDLIKRYVKQNYRFVIVTGGGNVARSYIEGLPSDLSEGERDLMGIRATWMNAQLLSFYLRDVCPPILPQSFEDVVQWHSQFPVIICGGLMPAIKTDEDAAIAADYYRSVRLINITNVDGVYEADPNKHPEAKKFEFMTYSEFFSLIRANSLKAGSHAPFTLVGATLLARSNIPFYVVSKDLEYIEKAIKGEKVGTIIGKTD